MIAFSCSPLVLFQCLSQHDLVGAQDISHLKKIVFTVLARLHEDRAYKNAYEVTYGHGHLSEYTICGPTSNLEPSPAIVSDQCNLPLQFCFGGHKNSLKSPNYEDMLRRESCM